MGRSSFRPIALRALGKALRGARQRFASLTGRVSKGKKRWNNWFIPSVFDAADRRFSPKERRERNCKQAFV
jgi:hypothetical protein